MTIALGGVHKGSVWLVADSRMSDSEGGFIDSQDKLLLLHPYLGLAWCGDSEWIVEMEILFREESDNLHVTDDPRTALLSSVVPKAMKLIRKINGKRKDDDPEMEGEAIIAYCGHLLVLEDSGAVYTVSEDYVAVGTGSELAIGSLQGKAPSRQNLVTAAKVACAKNLYCGGPIRALKVDI